MTLAVQDALDWTPMTPQGAGSPRPGSSAPGFTLQGADRVEVVVTGPTVPAPRPADPTPVILHAVHSDPRASHVAARRVLRVAVNECAARNQDRVHIAWFRHLLPEWIDPHSVGAAISGWTAAGYLVAIPDQWEPNGGGSNAAKPTQIRRLVQPIPPITR